MKKMDLQKRAGISWTSVTKLSKGETVSMEVLMKICKELDCDIGDIMDFIPEKDEVGLNVQRILEESKKGNSFLKG